MKRKKGEERNEIVVLDSGIDTAAAENPFMACCSGPYMTVWRIDWSSKQSDTEFGNVRISPRPPGLSPWLARFNPCS